MRKRNSIVAVGLLFAGLMTSQLWGTWAQVDHATKDEQLRNITNDGSRAFLNGMTKMEEAMIAIDRDRLAEGGRTGREAAAEFRNAQRHFEIAVAMLNDKPEVRNELEGFLERVDFDSKRRALGVPSDGPRTWNSVVNTARDSGPLGLYRRRTNQAEAMSVLCREFFDGVSSERLDLMKQARLLRHAASDLEYSAYLSALFRTKPGSEARHLFLNGMMTMQAAMVRIDEGKLQEAASIGREAADKFKNAQESFAGEVSDLKANAAAQEFLGDQLKRVDFGEFAAALGVKEQPSDWTIVSQIAKQKGAIGLFTETSERAKKVSEICGEFFDAVSDGRLDRMQQSRVWREAAVQMEFGAYVSAVFAKPE